MLESTEVKVKRLSTKRVGASSLTSGPFCIYYQLSSGVRKVHGKRPCVGTWKVQVVLIEFFSEFSWEAEEPPLIVCTYNRNRI